MSRSGLSSGATRWCCVLFATGLLPVACGTDDPSGGGKGGEAQGGSSSNTAGDSEEQPPAGSSTVGGSASTKAAAGDSQGGQGQGDAPATDGTAGVGNASGDGGWGGDGGAGGDASSSTTCVERKLFGVYHLDAHARVRTCFKSDFSCGEWRDEKDAGGTISLWATRESPAEVTGKLELPGVVLGQPPVSYDIWDSALFFYYPAAGEHPDIWTIPPDAQLGLWDPARAQSWVRVVADTCFGLSELGSSRIDIDLVTGRVLAFARKCDADYSTIWEEYRQVGTGSLACDLANCNGLANTAPPATVTNNAPLPTMTGGSLTPGSYHLTSIAYTVGDACADFSLPGEVRETLSIAASNATHGSLDIVNERAQEAALRSTHSYQLNGSPSMATTIGCGAETLAFAGSSGEVAYTASSTEVRMMFPISACNGNHAATYVYTKQ
jgi:hypothetical protein